MNIPIHQVWLLVGFLGQAIFGARFLVQWLASEKHGRSIIPHIFWYMSIVGSVLLFAYAIYRNDPVFIVGQGLGIFIYLRNIVLIKREKNAA